MAIVLETQATKEEVLELYLNEVYLGHRGSFALHGVAEAARIFYAKDLSNISLAEGALLAGVIQSPGNHSPFADVDRARERRNVVLRAMADAGFITSEAAERASHDPVQVAARAVDFEAPYFVDFVGQRLDEEQPALATRSGPLEVYTTLDLNLQRAAQDAVRIGLAAVDETLARRTPPRPAAGGAGRPRSAHRRGAGAGRRPLLQPVAVQPRHQRPPPAGLGVQAVRLPGRLRSRRQGSPRRRHPGDAAARRADDLADARGRLVARQLRRRVPTA